MHGRDAVIGAMTPAEFQAATGVSRETLERLEAYAAVLRKWQPTVNLVGPSTIQDLWRRHMLDSAQLATYCPGSAQTLVDLGSGAGFPGLVLAILGARTVHLIESNQRKAAFLEEAARVTAALVTVLAQRIEDVDAFPADIITARALASVDTLLAHAQPFLHSESVCLFLKGRRAASELTAAGNCWYMRAKLWPSLSNSAGHIMHLTEITRAR